MNMNITENIVGVDACATARILPPPLRARYQTSPVGRKTAELATERPSQSHGDRGTAAAELLRAFTMTGKAD